MNERITVFWFRRDLRLDDNHGLYQALNSGGKVLPIFIFDKNILDELIDRSDARLNFIHNSLESINNSLVKYNSCLRTYFATPIEAFKQIRSEYNIKKVVCNHDYEPYAIRRDEKVKDYLLNNEIEFESYKDQVIFEKEEILKEDGTPYLVYSPYSKIWLSKLSEESIQEYPSKEFMNWLKVPFKKIHLLSELGFKSSLIQVPKASIVDSTLKRYEIERDFPDKNGTSRLGVHLRFGTISIRQLIRQVKGKSDTFLKELIWREFFMMILYYFPRVISNNFNLKFDGIKWRNNTVEFDMWKNGITGFPMVDAGMRELNQSGFMHNRVRMVVASFLCKHLLIDWRWGEAYFAEKLLDYDLSANNGNWQWVAGTGVDAAPYFRIFNPTTQLEKFDNSFTYIRKWIKDFDEPTYPSPIIDHSKARNRAITTYKKALNAIN